MSISVLIADDEPLALERLADILGDIDGVELVARAGSGTEAIQMIEELRPDLVMLDVEMPKIDGFDVIEAIVRHPSADGGTPAQPLVCFVTAYPQFAADAFDSNALDFLCKPVRLSRLEQTIQRAREALAAREAVSRLEQLSGELATLRERRSGTSGEDFLWVQQRGQTARIAFSALDWVEAEGEYVRLHSRGQSYLQRGAIGSYADELEPHGFLRIHRSAIINEARIAAIHSSRAGVSVKLEDGLVLPVGRKYRSAVRALAPRRGEETAA